MQKNLRRAVRWAAAGGAVALAAVTAATAAGAAPGRGQQRAASAERAASAAFAPAKALLDPGSTNSPGLPKSVTGAAPRSVARAASDLAAQQDGISVVNSASFENPSFTVATGAFLTIYTTAPVTSEPATQYPFPATRQTPAGVFVQTDACAPGGPVARLPILYVGPSGFGGTQLNVYYPNGYFGGRNTEPFPCPAFERPRITVHASNGTEVSTVIQLSRVAPGIFTADNFTAPSGYHLNAVTGAQTPISTCNADGTGRACPVSTNGVRNFLILFTTGGEMLGCPDFAVPCTPPFAGFPTQFFLAAPGSPGGSGSAQDLAFYGWAGFLGQEQANIRLTADIGAGTYSLWMRVPNFFISPQQRLAVKLGPAN